MSAPTILAIAIFGIYPILRGISYSFFDIDINKQEWIGFANYAEIFKDKYFWIGVKNTLKFTIFIVPPTVLFPLIVAVLAIDLPKALGRFIRAGFYLPTITAGVIIVGIWKSILAVNGLLNKLLGTEIAWLGSNPYAFWAIVAITISTHMGPQLIIYIAALSTADKNLIDGARIDGCGWWRVLRHVYFPAVENIVVYFFVMRTAGTLLLYQYPLLMTGGGPNYGTLTMALQIYQQGFLYARWGYASALGVIFTISMCMIAFFQLKLRRKDA